MPQPPSLFLSHGAPTLVLEDVPLRGFLRRLGRAIARPGVIVVVTAHWETAGVAIGTAGAPGTIHDFCGFPPELYAMRYPAPGAPTVAASLAAALVGAGFDTTCDAERGLDHGTWVPLACMYPEADVPVVQVSVCPERPAAWHRAVGRAIGAALADTDALVIGSGALTHNLADGRAFLHRRGPVPTLPYAVEFADWVAARLSDGDEAALDEWARLAPHAARAHPSPEHFLPLHVALGAAGADWTGERLHGDIMYGCFATDCYRFAPRAARAH